MVKVARPRQDMRFDIPIIGMKTIETLKEAGASVLAVESGKTLLLEIDKVIKSADESGICIVAV